MVYRSEKLNKMNRKNVLKCISAFFSQHLLPFIIQICAVQTHLPTLTTDYTHCPTIHAIPSDPLRSHYPRCIATASGPKQLRSESALGP